MNKKQTIKNILSYALAIFAIIIIFKYFLPKDFVNVIRGIYISNIFISIIILISMYIISGIKLFFILKIQYKIKFNLFDIIFLPITMGFWGYIIPIKGGLIYSVYFLKSKYKVKVAEGISIGIYSVLITLFISGLISMYFVIVNGIFFSFFSLISLLFVLTPFFIYPLKILFNKIVINNIFLLKIKRLIYNIITNINLLFKRIKVSIVIIILGLVHICLTILLYFSAFNALQFNISFILIILLTLLLQLSSIIKLTPGNLGVSQIVAGSIFYLLANNSEQGIMLSLYVSFISFIVIFSIGLISSIYYFKYFKINKNKICNNSNNINIIHIHHNNLKYATRVKKEIESIEKIDCINKIFVLGFYKNGLFENEKIGNKIEIIRIKLFFGKFKKSFISKVIIMLEYLKKSIKIIKEINPAILHLHSLETLIIGIYYKCFINKSVKIIYDAHELETEKSIVQSNKQLKYIYRFLEKTLLKYTDYTIVVSNKICDWYKNKYSNIKIVILRNIPVVRKKKTKYNIKKIFNIQNNEILYVYSGSLDRKRGIKLLLDTFSKINDKHIVFMGYGEYLNMIKEYVNKFNNIHYHNPVEYDEVTNTISNADVGFNLTENPTLSNYYSLANKLFEYLFSGIPVIINNFPERASIIDEFNCGWKINEMNNDEIEGLIQKINLDDIKIKKNNTYKIKDVFKWEYEEKKLLNIYDDLLIKN